MPRMHDESGLAAAKIEALLRRYLDGESGVEPHRLPGGLGFLCHGPFGREAGAEKRLFVVAMDGGVLLRLPGDARDRILGSGAAGTTAALPDWLGSATFSRGPVRVEAALFVGAPAEWVWMPLADASAFERRRPHIHEALEFCQRSLAPTRTRE